MKRFFNIFLLSFALLTFCSCSDQSAVREPQNDSSETTNSDSVSDLTETDDENEPMIFTKDFDGLVLTVTTDKSAYSAGDEINVTAALENRSDKDVNLFYWMYPETFPVELKIEVEKLIQHPLGSRVIVTPAAEYVAPVKPGEKYEQSYKYLTYLGSAEKTTEDGELIYVPDTDKLAEAGAYKGTYVINICGPNPDRPDDGVTTYSLEFSITIK